nr:MAG TPA: hypothetical protein [Caudoviricetes sp.]
MHVLSLFPVDSCSAERAGYHSLLICYQKSHINRKNLIQFFDQL